MFFFRCLDSAHIHRLVQLLPKENVLLLRNIIAMLHHIQLSAEHNQMNSFNLAVCIAHSCLWNSNQQSQEKDAKKVSMLYYYQFIIISAEYRSIRLNHHYYISKNIGKCKCNSKLNLYTGV